MDKTKKTFLLIEELGEGVIKASAAGNSDSMGRMLTAFLVTKPDLIPLFKSSILIAEKMQELHDSGDVDLTKMLQTMDIKHGDTSDEEKKK